jgi:hypothetical protein
MTPRAARVDRARGSGVAAPLASERAGAGPPRHGAYTGQRRRMRDMARADYAAQGDAEDRTMRPERCGRCTKWVSISALTVLSVLAASALRARAAAPTADVPALAAELPSLGDAERRERVAALTPEQREELLRSLDAKALIEMGTRAAEALGTYSATLTKVERVGGEKVGPQKVKIWIQPEPFAVRLMFEDGPGKGRRLLYSSGLRADQLRVREAGLLGMAGALWLNLDSSLTRRDTNHPVTDIGFSALMTLIAKDFADAQAAGGHTRSDEGRDPAGRTCIRFTAPAAAQTYAAEARLCIDAVLGLPTRTEISDREGFLESYVYENVEGNLKLPEDHFTLAGAGL